MLRLENVYEIDGGLRRAEVVERDSCPDLFSAADTFELVVLCVDIAGSDFSLEIEVAAELNAILEYNAEKQ